MGIVRKELKRLRPLAHLADTNPADKEPIGVVEWLAPNPARINRVVSGRPQRTPEEGQSREAIDDGWITIFYTGRVDLESDDQWIFISGYEGGIDNFYPGSAVFGAAEGSGGYLEIQAQESPWGQLGSLARTFKMTDLLGDFPKGAVIYSMRDYYVYREGVLPMGAVLARIDNQAISEAINQRLAEVQQELSQGIYAKMWMQSAQAGETDTAELGKLSAPAFRKATEGMMIPDRQLQREFFEREGAGNDAIVKLELVVRLRQCIIAEVRLGIPPWFMTEPFSRYESDSLAKRLDEVIDYLAELDLDQATTPDQVDELGNEQQGSKPDKPKRPVAPQSENVSSSEESQSAGISTESAPIAV